MAPVHGLMAESVVASPMVILLAMMSLIVVASLLLVALICACGKKKEEELPPTLEGQQQQIPAPTGEQPQEQAPVVESVKETEVVKTAVEGPSRATEVKTSKVLEKTPDLQLTSQKPGQGGIIGVGNLQRPDRLPSLKLTGSPNSVSVDAAKGSAKSLKSKTVGSKTVPTKA